MVDVEWFHGFWRCQQSIVGNVISNDDPDVIIQETFVISIYKWLNISIFFICPESNFYFEFVNRADRGEFILTKHKGFWNFYCSHVNVQLCAVPLNTKVKPGFCFGGGRGRLTDPCAILRFRQLIINRKIINLSRENLNMLLIKWEMRRLVRFAKNWPLLSLPPPPLS